MEERIGFRFEDEERQENYEATVAGFCDCLFEALTNLTPEEGDEMLTNLHEKIYGELLLND